jgi:tetratricopeptide (TPR) repeat protein
VKYRQSEEQRFGLRAPEIKRKEKKLLMMRVISLFLIFSFFALFQMACATKPAIRPNCEGFYTPYIETIHWYPFKDKIRELGHFTLDESLRKEFEETGFVHLERGQFMGRVQETPSRLSDRHDDTIKRAEEFYSENKFDEAAQLLYSALQDEPENLFILNELAHTLFWIKEKRTESFDLYKKLISLLDALSEDKHNSIRIDMWFSEAYWKLGCLYLDRKEYEKAIFEITRGMFGMMAINPIQPAYENALSYLCEAYYFLGNYSFSKYFACKALEINPKNEYVMWFLAQMKDKNINTD